MFCNGSPKGCGHTPLRWKIPLQLAPSADADLCWAVFEVLPALRRERKRKGWTIFRSTESLGGEPGGGPETQQRLRGHPLPCSLKSQLLSQVKPWSEQRVRALTATHTWTSAASHKAVQKQEKSPMNVKLKKAAALMSIFGMNWRILLFQLQPTCWFSSAALLFCSFPFSGLS